LDEIDDIADESPQALGQGSADRAGTTPVPEEVPPPAPIEHVEAGEPRAEADVPKPALYLLRPRGLRPPSRPARARSRRLRNDCPPDRRHTSNRPSPKPRLR
jgi:hypothetical protein